MALLKEASEMFNGTGCVPAISIVFASAADPLGTGLVASLARPGGSITGFSSFDPQMTGKWLEMLTQISPLVAHAAVLFDPKTALLPG